MDDVTKASRFTLALLDQDQVWVDGQGHRHDITEMSVRYKANVVAFLERRAAALEFHYSFGEVAWLGSVVAGEMAMDALEYEVLAEQNRRMDNPLAWLRSTPLLKRLNKDIAANRGGEDD